MHRRKRPPSTPKIIHRLPTDESPVPLLNICIWPTVITAMARLRHTLLLYYDAIDKAVAAKVVLVRARVK